MVWGWIKASFASVSGNCIRRLQASTQMFVIRLENNLSSAAVNPARRFSTVTEEMCCQITQEFVTETVLQQSYILLFYHLKTQNFWGSEKWVQNSPKWLWGKRISHNQTCWWSPEGPLQWRKHWQIKLTLQWDVLFLSCSLLELSLVVLNMGWCSGSYSAMLVNLQFSNSCRGWWTSCSRLKSPQLLNKLHRYSIITWGWTEIMYNCFN